MNKTREKKPTLTVIHNLDLIVNGEENKKKLEEYFFQHEFACDTAMNIFIDIYNDMVTNTDFVTLFDQYMKSYGDFRIKIRKEIEKLIYERINEKILKDIFIDKFGENNLLVEYVYNPNKLIELFKEGIFKSGKIEFMLKRLELRKRNIYFLPNFYDKKEECLKARIDVENKILNLTEGYYASINFDKLYGSISTLITTFAIKEIYLKKDENNKMIIDIVFNTNKPYVPFERKKTDFNTTNK